MFRPVIQARPRIQQTLNVAIEFARLWIEVSGCGIVIRRVRGTLRNAAVATRCRVKIRLRRARRSQRIRTRKISSLCIFFFPSFRLREISTLLPQFHGLTFSRVNRVKKIRIVEQSRENYVRDIFKSIPALMRVRAFVRSCVPHV